MELDERYKLKAFIYSNKKLYTDDSHSGAFSQILCDNRINPMYYECEDEYEVISNVDENAIFGSVYKIEEGVYPVIFTNKNSTHLVNLLYQQFGRVYKMDDNDELRLVK